MATKHCVGKKSKIILIGNLKPIIESVFEWIVIIDWMDYKSIKVTLGLMKHGEKKQINSAGKPAIKSHSI